jgi:hypothetical protein
MARSHYSKTTGKPDGIWLWCMHCERCYKAGEYREIKGLQMCPYADCDGDTVLDPWTWKHIQKIHPNYPQEPERGKIYPLY